MSYTLDSISNLPLDSFSTRFSFNTESSSSSNSRQAAEDLATLLLQAEKDGDEALYREISGVFLHMLARALGPGKDSYEKLLSLSLCRLLEGESEKLPLHKSDLEPFLYEAVAKKICDAFPRDPATPFEGEQWNEDSPAVKVAGGKMEIYPFGKSDIPGKKLSQSLVVADEAIKVFQKESGRLKQSESADLDRIRSFTTGFLMALPRNIPRNPRTYAIGDTLEAKIIQKDLTGFTLRSTDPEFKTISGRLTPGNTYYYSKEAILDGLLEGDIIECTVTGDNPYAFSIESALVGYLYEEAERKFKDDRDGIVIMENGDYLVVLTDLGYPLQCPIRKIPEEMGRPNLFDTVRARYTGKNKGNKAWLTGEITGKSEAKLDRREISKDALAGFVFPDDTPSGKLPDRLVKEVCQGLFSLSQASSRTHEKVTCLEVCRILSSIDGDTISEDYAAFLADYLSSVAYFSKGEYSKVKALIPSSNIAEEDSVDRCVRIVNVLKEYGSDDERYLHDVIEGEKDETIISIAKLILSANRTRDVVSPGVRNILCREILKKLALQMESVEDIEEIMAEYLGIEDAHKEFKTSFVYPPDSGMQPNIDRQKDAIFKGMCAFMNSESGGTLYLGVNDLGYVSGIGNDIGYIEKHTHYKGIDGYIRLILDMAKKAFPLDALTTVDIESMYSGKVVAIHVPPCQDRIVSVQTRQGKKTYYRLVNESIEMDEKTQRRLLAERTRRNAMDSSHLVAALSEAISQKKKAILHNYSSSSSDTESDRKVEPFEFSMTKTYVRCYEGASGKCKLFRISRIGNVEILDEQWTDSRSHISEPTDIFNMGGGEKEDVTIRLDRTARNLLLDEYPASKEYVKREEGQDSWILSTTICSPLGAGRFCLGLAEHLQILQGERLRSYMEGYARKYILPDNPDN